MYMIIMGCFLINYELKNSRLCSQVIPWADLDWPITTLINSRYIETHSATFACCAVIVTYVFDKSVTRILMACLWRLYH